MWLLFACAAGPLPEAPAPFVNAQETGAGPAGAPGTCADRRVFPGDLRVTDTATAAAFCASFNAVGGSLTVTGVDWTDLSPLECLCDVGGAFVLRDAPALAGLGGLEHLGSVRGRLLLRNLDALAEVDLPGLRHVGGRMSVEPGPGLVALSAPALDSVGALSVAYAPDLATVRLPALTTVEKDLAFYGSDQATDLPMPALTRVGGVLYLDEMDALVDLGGFAGLREIGSLEVVGADRLVSLTGPSPRELPGALLLDGDPALASLDGLAGLVSVGSIQIRNNPSLVDVRGLGGVTQVAGDLVFVDNPALPAGAVSGLLDSIGAENVGGAATAR